jgi:hypothetical protein
VTAASPVPGARRPAGAAVTVSTAEWGVSVVRPLPGGMLIAVFGAVPGTRALDPEAARLVEEVLGRVSPGAQENPWEILEWAARGCDVELREHFGHGSTAGRGTLVLGWVRGETIWLGRTGYGAVLLRRGDALIALQDADHRPTAHWQPWLGSRDAGREDAVLVLDCPPQGLPLVAGDRLVLCTLPVHALADVKALQRMVEQGSPESAAQTLSGAIRAHRRMDDVAVVMCALADPLTDTEISSDQGDPTAFGLGRDVLDGLATLLAEITEDTGEQEETGTSELQVLSVEAVIQRDDVELAELTEPAPVASGPPTEDPAPEPTAATVVDPPADAPPAAADVPDHGLEWRSELVEAPTEHGDERVDVGAPEDRSELTADARGTGSVFGLVLAFGLLLVVVALFLSFAFLA